MDEKQADLLSKYDLEIYRANRMKGAWVLETGQGLKLLGGSPFSEGKLAFEQRVKNHAREHGFPAVDSYVLSREGSYLVQGPYGEGFVMRDWYAGEECDTQNIGHVLATTKALAQLHNSLIGMELTEEEKTFCMQPRVTELLERRNRELRRVRAYIRAKKQKSSFEQKFLSQFSMQYEQAERATGLLDDEEYEGCYRKAVENGTMLHGNFTHHSVILGKDTVAVTGFQKAAMGVQIHDFYLLFRKILEKWDWDVTMGQKMLEAYEDIRPLSGEERRLLLVLLSYPEKFWKVANQYYNNRKSWIPEKNMQKLIQTMEQAGKKEETIQVLFT